MDYFYVEIKNATIEDFRDIQSLNKRLFDSEFDKYDDTIDVNWPLSKEGEEFYRRIDIFAELDDMYILEEHRNKGYGGLLYDRFIDWCKSKNVKRLKLLVTAKNKQAIEFYKKKGFEDYNITLETSL